MRTGEQVQPKQPTEPGLVHRFYNNNGTGADVQRRGHSFSLAVHTTVFQPEPCACKACVMEDIEEEYTCTNIYILSDSHAAIKALDSFKKNSKLVRDCHQSLLKLTDITGSNWYGCWDTWELMEMRQLMNWPDKAPRIH
jgi:hypothetical protein